jgi:hypothetical protein
MKADREPDAPRARLVAAGLMDAASLRGGGRLGLPATRGSRRCASPAAGGCSARCASVWQGMGQPPTHQAWAPDATGDVPVRHDGTGDLPAHQAWAPEWTCRLPARAGRATRSERHAAAGTRSRWLALRDRELWWGARSSRRGSVPQVRRRPLDHAHIEDVPADGAHPWSGEDVRADGAHPWSGEDVRADGAHPWSGEDVRADGTHPWSGGRVR